MARIQNVLFGKLAVSTRFITEQQLEECLQEQRRMEAAGEQPPRLGELLEQKGYLTKQQIRSILETMASMQRRLFGEIAISFHFITLEQLQTALDVQRFLKSPMDSVPLFGQALIAYREFLKGARDGGPVPKIGEVLVAMGYLKEHQVEVILQEQNKKIVQCKQCGAGLNIGNFGEGQKLRCGQCSSVLILERNQFGELDATLPVEEPLPVVQRRPTEVGLMAVAGAGSGGAAAPSAPGAPSGGPSPAIARTKTGVTTRPSQIAKSPTIFGDFTIQSKLGQDSTGTLYKAQWTAKQRTVVVKIMNQAVMQDAAFAKRFTEEAKKVAGIAHPNIKKVFAIGQIDGKAYIAMEYVEGESVHAILTKQTRIHHTQALRIGKKIAEALKFAWDTAKIVHGDIRPSNILVLKTGEVMLSNLGLATKTAENILSIAKSGQLAPFYLAPEHVTEDRAIDCRSDIYSLGATLYHMIAGRPPYQGQSPFEVLVRLTEERVAPLKFFDATIPDAVCIVVEKMLAVEPDERYASYDDMIGDLSKIAEVSADVDASMLLGESPSKHRKTTVTLAAVGGAEVAVSGVGSDSNVRKRTTTVIRNESGDISTVARQASPAAMYAIIGGVAALLIAGFFVWSSISSSNAEEAAYDAADRECAQLVAQDRYDDAISKWNAFLAGHPNSGKTDAIHQKISAAESRKSSSASRTFEDLKKRIHTIAQSQGIPAAAGLFAPGSPGGTGLTKTQVDSLEELLQQEATQLFDEGTKAAWSLAKDKRDMEGARGKLTEIRSKLPADYGTRLDDEMGKLEAWIVEEKKGEEQAARKEREAESKKKLDAIAREVEGLAKDWDLDKAINRCNDEMVRLIEKHQADLRRLQGDIETVRGFRQKVIDYWSPILSTNQNPKPENDPRPEFEVDGKSCRLCQVEVALLDFKDKDGKVAKKPWKEMPIELFYEQIGRPAVRDGNGDNHFALGTVLLRAGDLADADKEFAEARNQGRSVDPYGERLDEEFSAKAEELFGQEKSMLKAGKPRDALSAAMRLRREYGTRKFCKDHAADVDDVTVQIFKAIAGNGEYFPFNAKEEWSRWATGGGATWDIAGGVLTAAGSKGAAELKEKGVTEVLVMLQLPDPKTRFTIQLGGEGGYKMLFTPSAKNTVTCQGPKGLHGKPFPIEADRWYLVRIDYSSTNIFFYLDDQEIHKMPASEKPDDIALIIEGPGGHDQGKVVLDNLLIRHEK